MLPLHVSVNITEHDEQGAIIPNPLFHRAFNKLHSRCVEYPFAASMLVPNTSILDLGSAKADTHWLSLLQNFPARVTFFDHDPPQSADIPLVRGDCRHLPFADQSFDLVCAVSLIEHIGLLSPQVVAGHRPTYSLNGDVETLRECSRVLKPRGKLILTIPMGVRSAYAPDASARVYSAKDIARFAAVLQPLVLDYYEYQLHKGQSFLPAGQGDPHNRADWRRIDLRDASAENRENMDGILCSTWMRKA